MKKMLALLATLAGVAGLAAAALVYWGAYDVSATNQHLRPTYWLLDVAMRRAVKRRAADIVVPPLDAPALRARGLVLYREHCVQCHGAPGEAPEPFALGLTPAAANLAYTAREWPAAEIYWVVRNGIKMAGMPAWAFRMSEPDLWAVTTFVMQLPELSPQRYRELAAAAPRTAGPNREPLRAAADAARGRAAIEQYACLTCHEIPGVVGMQAPVGPPLGDFRKRRYIAGVLPNTHDNLVRWLRSPRSVDRHSAMPDLGVTEQHAHDIAAFLLDDDARP